MEIIAIVVVAIWLVFVISDPHTLVGAPTVGFIFLSFYEPIILLGLPLGVVLWGVKTVVVDMFNLWGK